MAYSRPLRIFSEEPLTDLFAKQQKSLKDEIENKEDDYVLNVSETDYISYMLQKYSIANLAIRADRLHISNYEKQIPAEQFPRFDFNVYEGRSYKRDIIKYHLPFEGDRELLRRVPNSRILWTTDVTIEDGCICFEIVNFYNSSEIIQKQAKDIIEPICQQADNITNEVRSFNSSLPDYIQNVFQNRKQHILDRSNLLASLGVPLKQRNDYPGTFAIPTPNTRKSISVKLPQVHEKGYRPEPTLEDSTYNEILQIIHDMGKQFERMPSTYGYLSEEGLRDHILLILEPRFQGSATGETFNKTGKTDILLRYQGSNVFIGECKFWKGIKGFLDTLTQLLTYLTWRDSKAAVVMFVRNADFSSVVSSVESDVSQHSNFLGFVNKQDETWLNYRFHINDDRNREVKLAVLLFHIPKI